MTAKPNIVIFMVDQLNGVFFENGPADFIHAPNLKRLAASGVNFSAAYCASPLCAPARASFMSGLLPSATGVYDNAAEFPSTIPTFAHGLRANGYKTILSGKMHFVGADQLHGFEERLTTDIYPADFGWTPDWSNPLERVDWWYHNLSSVTQAGVAATSNQLEFDDDVAYQAKLKLHQLARERTEQPFCLTVSFTHPHDPYVTRQQYWDLYPEGSIPPVNTTAIPEDEADPHSKRLYHAVDSLNFDIQEQDISNARRAYFANVSYLDEKIGELMDTLEECGMSENTLVVFTADHGDMLGERGLWYKMTFFEGSMRVPLIFTAPWLRQAQIEQPVSTLDLTPTLLELGAVDYSDWSLHGVSLNKILEGDSLPSHTVLGEYTAEGSVAPMIMLRDARYKFNYCEADPPQLFDISADPHELNDLAANSENSQLLQRYSEQVQQRWDIAKFQSDVERSQKGRQLVYQGLRQGRYESWDWQPMQDASQRYMRNHLDLNELEAKARFPSPSS